MESVNYIHAIQYIGFLSAQLTNTLFIYLLYSKADSLFGSYRHVMGVFAVYSLVYTWIEILTQPIMHIYGPVFIVMMDSVLKYQTWIGNLWTCLYCASFGLCIALLAAQFFYRFLAVCRPADLDKIKGVKLGLMFIPCIVCFVAWFCSVHFRMHNTIEKQEFMKNVISSNYGEDVTRVSFIAAMYFSTDQNDKKVWSLRDLMGVFGCTFIITFCFSTIIICAIYILKKLKDAQNLMSAKTRELNKQLFVALSFQTVFPFLMMHAPVGLLLIFPLLEIDAGRLANICGITAGIYPAIEPLIAIFCIKDFRKVVMCRNIRSVEPGSHHHPKGPQGLSGANTTVF